LNPPPRSTFSAWQPAQSNSHAWPITIGPEPIRQIEWRSGRLGKDAHLLDPALEDRPRVVRTGPRFRVELNRARVLRRQVEPFDRLVVEGDVRRLPRVRRFDREAVVLRGDEHPA